MTGKATIGSISSGTLRDQDLLEAFAGELEQLEPIENYRPAGPSAELIEQACELIELLDDDDLIREPRGEAEIKAGEVIAELHDALDGHALPYCYFGAIEGDGAEFGFWPCIESLEQDAFNCPACPMDVLKVNDTVEVPSYVMRVNDHGNVTLYRVELIEEWATG